MGGAATIRIIKTDGTGFFANNVGIGVAAHANASLNITNTDQHIRLNNGSELGIISLDTAGKLDLWAHGTDETINFRTGTGSGTVALDITGINSTFTGMITVNGGGIDIDNNDDIRLRFDNASTFKAGLQVATTAGDMIAGSAVNDFAIRSQSNMLFATGGNTERMRIDSSGNTTITTTSNQGGLTVTSATDNTVIGINNTATNGQAWRLTKHG